MDIYREKLLDHYNNPRNFGDLLEADHTVELQNISCGDAIKMQLRVEKGVITDIAFTGEGCAVAIASASILTEYAKGKPLEEIQALDLEKLQEMIGVQFSLSRLKCAGLGLESLKKGVAESIANITN